MHKLSADEQLTAKIARYSRAATHAQMRTLMADDRVPGIDRDTPYTVVMATFLGTIQGLVSALLAENDL